MSLLRLRTGQNTRTGPAAPRTGGMTPHSTKPAGSGEGQKYGGRGPVGFPSCLFGKPPPPREKYKSAKKGNPAPPTCSINGPPTRRSVLSGTAAAAGAAAMAGIV